MIDRDSDLHPLFCRRSLLVGANGGAVDHLDVAVTGGGNGVHQPVPHASLPPSHEAVIAGGAWAVALRQVTPRRTGAQYPKMPFSTRRSFTRGTPGGLLGNSGSTTRPSKSVKSYRLIPMLNQMRVEYGSRRWLVAAQPAWHDRTMPQVKLIVAADEPAIFFASVHDAESWMEAIDVEDGVYSAAFGPNGEPYTISSNGTRVHIKATGEAPKPEALKALLMKYFDARGETPGADLELSALLERCSPT